MNRNNRCTVHYYGIRLFGGDAGILLDECFTKPLPYEDAPYYHYHASWEIFFADGKAFIMTPDGTLELNNEYCFIAPMTRHRIKMQSGSQMSMRLELPDVRDNRSAAALTSFMSKYSLKPQKPGTESVQKAAMLKKAFKDHLDAGEGTLLTDSVGAAATMLLCSIFASFEDSGELIRLPGFRQSFTPSMMLEYIMSHENINDVSVSQLADLLGYSSEQTSRIIKRTFGMPLRSFERDINIERAAGYLEYTDLSVLEISQKLGYSSAKTFSASFRAVMGGTPSEYRRAIRASPSEMARISKYGTSTAKRSKT